MATRKNGITEKASSMYESSTKQDTTPKKDLYEYVDHPEHYNQGGIELVEIVDAYQLGFYEGNIIKYILRAGKKPGSDRLQDLRKAQWYLNYLIKQLQD